MDNDRWIIALRLLFSKTNKEKLSLDGLSVRTSADIQEQNSAIVLSRNAKFERNSKEE
jgi:hypothetical protein